MSIRIKLFLALLGTGSLVALAMFAFMGWSFERGLADLMRAREEQQIDAISERLAEVYRRDHGWDGLRQDRRLWVTTLFGATGREAGGHRPGRGPGRHLRDLMQPGTQERSTLWPPGTADTHGLQEQSRVWPPPRALSPRAPEAPPLPVELRLMLLDAGGEVLYGRPQLLPGTSRYPVELDGVKIGELALLPGPSAADLGEVQFQARHARALVLVALGMIALSALVAFTLTHRLVRPVLGFQATARRLAAGDLRARAPTGANDELGRLGRDLNTLAETLEANEQARRRWVADISHELRTPLSLLRAELEALQDGLRPMDRAAVDALHGDALRLKRLVDDLHDLSLTDLGAQSYRKVELDPATILAEDCSAFEPSFAAAGLSLTLDADLPQPVHLLADPDRLSQLFRNLLRNSLAYTDPGGALQIAMTRTETGLAIDFRDGPPGVPAQALPHLFERLYRVEGSRSRDTGGAGLGLAIASNIVVAHGGRIEAGQAPQGGLWVHIELPVQTS